MDPHLNIGIVAHTSRAAAAKKLAAATNADYLSVDDGTLGAEGNHRATQTHLAGIPTTWTVILEDDAQPIDGFRHHLEQALLMAPSPIVSLYLGRQRPPHWQKRIAAAVAEANTTSASWIISGHLLHAVGYAIRTHLLPSLLAHHSPRPVDEHITSWAKQYGHTVAYTVGSLVDHADWPTIVAHRDRQPRRPGRTAWQLGGRNEWTTRAVTLR